MQVQHKTTITVQMLFTRAERAEKTMKGSKKKKLPSVKASLHYLTLEPLCNQCLKCFKAQMLLVGRITAAPPAMIGFHMSDFHQGWSCFFYSSSTACFVSGELEQGVRLFKCFGVSFPHQTAYQQLRVVGLRQWWGAHFICLRPFETFHLQISQASCKTIYLSLINMKMPLFARDGDRGEKVLFEFWCRRHFLAKS